MSKAKHGKKLTRKERAEQARRSRALTIALAAAGIGVAAGTTIVLGLHGIMKKIIVNESWPDEEWSNDDWAGEDLEN